MGFTLVPFSPFCLGKCLFSFWEHVYGVILTGVYGLEESGALRILRHLGHPLS